MRITYFFKLFTYHCESLVDTFRRPGDGHNSFRTRTVWYVYLSTTLQKTQKTRHIFIYKMLHHVRAKSRKTCTCNNIIEGKETYIFPKLLNVISFLKNIQTVLLITHHIQTKMYILLHIKISHFLDYFDI